MLHTGLNRILIIRAGAIGDFVLTLPAIGALRDAFPTAFIQLMGNLATLELACPQCASASRGSIGNRVAKRLSGGSFHHADSITSIEVPGLGRFFERSSVGDELAPESWIPTRASNAKEPPLPRNLVDYFSRFDLIVAYWRDPTVFGDNLRRAGVRRVIAVDSFPPPGVRKHICDHLIGALKPLGIPTTDRDPRIYLTEEERRFAQDYLRERAGMSSVKVAVHPGSGGITKTWPPERFARVIRWLIEEWGAEVVLVSGPADVETTSTVLESLTERLKRRTAVAEDLSLRQLAAVLGQCSCFVGNDSGVTHISAAVSTPTVAIFGPTDPGVWGPRGRNVEIVKGLSPCAPCSREDRQTCQDRVCLSRISVGQVVEAIVRVTGRP